MTYADGAPSRVPRSHTCMCAKCAKCAGGGLAGDEALEYSEMAPDAQDAFDVVRELRERLADVAHQPVESGARQANVCAVGRESRTTARNRGSSRSWRARRDVCVLGARSS
jgi:hypothetical protein